MRSVRTCTFEVEGEVEHERLQRWLDVVLWEHDVVVDTDNSDSASSAQEGYGQTLISRQLL